MRMPSVHKKGKNLPPNTIDIGQPKLTYKEKKDHHVEAIFSIAYIEGQALDSCWPLWKDGELVDPSEYEGINVNAEGRQAAAIIRKYMEGRK